MLQRCIWLSTQACEEVVSGGGFLFFLLQREVQAPGSLSRQGEEEGSYKYHDNSRNKLVRRGRMLSEQLCEQ